MRVALATAFVAGLLVCAGCFTATPPLTTPPAPKVSEMPKAPPPVTPESVTYENPRAALQALSDELDRDEQKNLLNRTRD